MRLFYAASTAYGNNMANLGDGNFAVFSGDVDQNGDINQDDFSEVEIGSGYFITGYLNDDLTGDGLIESSDYSLIENNLGKISAKP